MIFLLRNIRQKLLSNNKVATYLLYAIGEIILVVIGILIAVNIDNWNEANQRKELENKLLEEMISDLALQADDILININTHQASMASCKVIRNTLLEERPYHDTLSQHFVRVYNFTIFHSKNGAYKMLETQGISLISDDHLRAQITNYFDISIPFQLEIQQVTIKQIQAASENHLKLFKNLNWAEPMEPWDYQSLAKNKEYISWLSYTSANKSFELSRFKNLLEENKKLSLTIKKVLAQSQK